MAAALDLEALAEGVLQGKRRALAKAITLVEGSRADQRALAHRLVSSLLPHSGRALRVGITGVPGVGKSTFIEALGLMLLERGHRVAVLAVDPSSQISGGSIMGDKVRMERLSREERAFIRPSPAAGSLGGVNRCTRESMLLCEAAGFDVLIIETVGVGQSEITVSEMVDFFLVLLLPGAGDEIQGIKKGIIEMADGLVVNKADGEMVKAAARAARYYRNAIHFSRPKLPGWTVPIHSTSALSGEGLDRVWDSVLAHRAFLEHDGQLERLRADQVRLWFHAALRDDLLDRLYGDAEIHARIAALIPTIEARQRSPHEAADEILQLFLKKAPQP